MSGECEHDAALSAFHARKHLLACGTRFTARIVFCLFRKTVISMRTGHVSCAVIVA